MVHSVFGMLLLHTTQPFHLCEVQADLDPIWGAKVLLKQEADGEPLRRLQRSPCSALGYHTATSQPAGG